MASRMDFGREVPLGYWENLEKAISTCERLPEDGQFDSDPDYFIQEGKQP